MKSQNLSDFVFEIIKKKENAKLLLGAHRKGQCLFPPALLIAQTVVVHFDATKIKIQYLVDKRIMKKVFVIILMGFLVFSCLSDDDDGIDCKLFDPAFPSLYIRIVDATGVNLIENGTIDSENITVQGDFANAGFRFVPADEFVVPDADIREFDNSLNLYIPNESSFQYSINLDDFETINLGFNAELTRIPCDITYFTPTSVTFNEEPIELTEMSSLQLLVIIEL